MWRAYQLVVLAAGGSIARARQTLMGATLSGGYLFLPRAHLVPPEPVVRNIELRLRLRETHRSIAQMFEMSETTIRMYQRCLRFDLLRLPALKWRNPVVDLIVATGLGSLHYVVYFHEDGGDFIYVLKCSQLPDFPSVFRAALVHMAQVEPPRYLGPVQGCDSLAFSVWPGLPFAVPLGQLCPDRVDLFARQRQADVKMRAEFHMVSINVSRDETPRVNDLTVSVGERWLVASLPPPAETQTPRFASQSEIQLGDTHIQVLEETGELLVQFNATLPADLAEIIAVGAELEPLNMGRAATHWAQLLPRGWSTHLRRIHRGSDRCSTTEAIAVEMSACKLLGQPMPSYQQLSDSLGVSPHRAAQLVREIVRWGLDVVPEDDDLHFCPNLGGCGALRRGLATMLLDADVNFGVWRSQLEELDAQVPAMKLEIRDFEVLTNVGQALIAARLLNLPMTRRAVSQLITLVVGANQGYSDSSVGRWLSTAQGLVPGAEVGIPE
jgi:hypothetical protein